jgi:DNA-binding CsgD family transcriptional regulator
MGGGLLIAGEAGIGKSRLLAEADRRARERRMLVLSGRAIEGSPAYRPVTQALLPELRAEALADAPELRPYRTALGRLLPEWAESASGGIDASVDPVLVLGEGIVRILRRLAGTTGCLVMLDDLHWADADTLHLLEYLTGAVQDVPVLIAVSARHDWLGSTAVQRMVASPGVTTLMLAPLTSLEVRQLAAARFSGPVPQELVDLVVDRSEGLPLLVEDLIGGVASTASEVGSGPAPAGTVPRAFAAEIANRMGSIAPAARRVLEASAVLGGDPDWSMVPAVADVDEDEVWHGLRAAMSVHLLVLDEGRLRWRHALTREAVLAGLLPPEHAFLARRAAKVLLTRREGYDEHAADLLLVAGQRAEATDVLLRLAGRERGRGAFGNADSLLRRAESTGALVAAVAAERVLLSTLTGRAVAALDSGEAALRDATGDDHAELCLQLALAAITTGKWPAAERYVERAGRPSDPRSQRLAAEAAQGAGRVAQAAALAAAAVDSAERSGRPDILCEALCTAGRISRLDDPERAASAFARAAQVSAELALAPARVEALIGLGTLELLASESAPSLSPAREIALDAGLLSAVASIDLLLAEQILLDGGPHSVLEPASSLREQTADLRLFGLQAMAGSLLALARAAIGDLPGMSAAVDEAVALPDHPPDVAALADAARAVAALMAHDLPAADTRLDAGIRPLLDHPVAAPLHLFGLWALLRTVAGDGGEEARAALRDLPAARRPANRAALVYADAVAAGRSGRQRQAATLFDQADATLRRSAWLRRVLRLLTLEAAVVDGWGDPVPHLRASLEEHERAEEHQLAATCRSLLRRAGAPTRRGRGNASVPPPLRAVGVTSREMDVLTLLREGLTNAEIASRLYLSTRTVETHVAHLLAKSGSATRSQLRSWSPSRAP